MDDERPAREERFRRLYYAHKGAVRAYAWRRGPDSADDVVAETFTIAWQNLDTVPAEPLPWLIGIARHVRLGQERADRRRRERERRCAEADVVPSFAGAVEERAALRSALERLTERTARSCCWPPGSVSIAPAWRPCSAVRRRPRACACSAPGSVSPRRFSKSRWTLAP